MDAQDKFHNGWLVTGDVAKLDEEGAIVISDRSKDVFLSAIAVALSCSEVLVSPASTGSFNILQRKVRLLKP